MGGDKKVKSKKPNEAKTLEEHIWHLDGMTKRQERNYPASKIIEAKL